MVVNERVHKRWHLGGLAAVGLLLLSGCTASTLQPAPDFTPESDGASQEVASNLDPCAKPNLTTVEPGAFTFATSEAPAPPFFLTEKPSDREGFEADLAYALAEELGFRSGQVTWEFVDPEQIISGEFVDFDVAIGGFTSNLGTPSSLVFSHPYLDIDPDELSINDDTEPDASTQDVRFVLALVSGNPLAACVDRALTDMTDEGTIGALRERWLAPAQLDDA